MSRNRRTGPISAVITTFNDGPMLEEALRSVAAQTVLPREIFVIDDGSKPATAPKIIDSITAEAGLDVKYYWQPNAGPSAARNAGLQRASQEFIAFLDSDDIWLSDHLERKLVRLNSRGAVYSTAFDSFIEFDGASGRALRTIAIQNYDGPISNELLGVPDGIPAGMQFQLHRRAALESINGFDVSIRVNEDFDLMLRLAAAGFRITGSNVPTVSRRVHPQSFTRRDPQRTLNETERFLTKAEHEGLLSPKAVASRRKWLRLSIGKQQILNDETRRTGIDTLREAFRFAQPKGPAQWAVFLAAKNERIATSLFGFYRALHQWRTRLRHPSRGKSTAHDYRDPTMRERSAAPATTKQVGPISAVITTFNEGDMLEEALRSVSEQSVLPREILVIDDGSEPAVAPVIIEKFAARTGLSVQYYWQPNTGLSAARNAGLQRTTEEYIAFLDADDCWLPPHLERKLAKLEALDATYSTAYDAFVEFDHESGRTLRTITCGSYDGPISANLLGMPGGIPAGMQFQLHRRTALNSVGGFDTSLRVGEDFDLLLRLRRAGFQITGSGVPTVSRRVHAASLTRCDLDWTLKETERFLTKAESEALLSSGEVASRRKWIRLSIGKKQIVNGSLWQGIGNVKDAFAFEQPKGLAQWGAFVLANIPIFGYPVFTLYRLLPNRWKALN